MCSGAAIRQYSTMNPNHQQLGLIALASSVQVHRVVWIAIFICPPNPAQDLAKRKLPQAQKHSRPVQGQPPVQVGAGRITRLMGYLQRREVSQM